MPATSPARVAANRTNARRSTGPRTPAGKRRASRNATTHGVFCADVVLPGENASLFREIRNQHLDAFRPQTIVELALVDRVVAATWRLRRLSGAEAALLGGKAAALAEQASAMAGRVAEEADDVLADENRTRGYRRARGLTGPDADPLTEAELAAVDEEFADTVARRDSLRATAAVAVGTEPGVAAAVTAAIVSADQPLERLARLRQRLEHEANRCHRELERLRDAAAKWAARPESPFADRGGVTDDADEAEDNEVLAEDDPTAAADEPAAPEPPADTGPIAAAAKPIPSLPSIVQNEPNTDRSSPSRASPRPVPTATPRSPDSPLAEGCASVGE